MGRVDILVPCTTNASVALTYGGQLFTIDLQDLVWQGASDNEGYCVSGISMDPENCNWVAVACEWTFLFLAYNNSFIIS